MDMKYRAWLRELLRRTGQTISRLENKPGMFPVRHAYSEAHLTADEAVEYYS